MKLMSKYKNAASSVGQWPAFLNSASFIEQPRAWARDDAQHARRSRHKEINVWDRDHLIVEMHSGLMSAIHVPRNRLRNFASNRSALLLVNDLTRSWRLLRLSASAATRTCSMVFYYAALSVSTKSSFEIC